MSPMRPATLTFARLEARHLPEILAIETEAYPEPWSLSMFRQEIHNPLSVFYVVSLNSALVGYGGFWCAAEEAHITSVTVRKEHRGQGLGRALARHILAKAAALGLERAVLEVRASNLRARNLYDSLGFECIGVRKGYYRKTREDAIVMALGLNAAGVREINE